MVCVPLGMIFGLLIFVCVVEFAEFQQDVSLSSHDTIQPISWRGYVPRGIWEPNGTMVSGDGGKTFHYQGIANYIWDIHDKIEGMFGSGACKLYHDWFDNGNGRVYCPRCHTFAGWSRVDSQDEREKLEEELKHTNGIYMKEA